jgi:membrane-associated protein
VHDLIDPSHLIKSFGYLGIFVTIFLESGVVVGFFLPGDSLLFAAGLLASQGYLNLAGLMLVAIIAAILGDNVGYQTGRRAGPTLFKKSKPSIFSPKLATKAHAFFEKKGPSSLILARFIPAIRCFTPIVAGVAQMRYQRFIKFNIIGALLWGTLLPALGFVLGKSVPNIDKYLLPLVLVVMIVSALPAIVHVLKAGRKPIITEERSIDL